jgi:hypothetical protein
MSCGSHPRELPLDGSHLRLAVTDLLLTLEVIAAPPSVIALAVLDLTRTLNAEVVFCLALEHGIVVLHATFIPFDWGDHMLGAAGATR